MKRIGHIEHQRAVERGRIVAEFGDQLIDRIEHHRLDAVARVEIRLGNPLVEILDRGLGPAVAVAVRIVQEFAAAEQRVIHAPRVDRVTREVRSSFDGLAKPDFKLVQQTAEIPAVMPRLFVRIIAEPVDLLKFQPPLANAAEDGASAARAQIERQITFFGFSRHIAHDSFRPLF